MPQKNDEEFLQQLNHPEQVFDRHPSNIDLDEGAELTYLLRSFDQKERAKKTFDGQSFKQITWNKLSHSGKEFRKTICASAYDNELRLWTFNEMLEGSREADLKLFHFFYRDFSKSRKAQNAIPDIVQGTGDGATNLTELVDLSPDLLDFISTSNEGEKKRKMEFEQPTRIPGDLEVTGTVRAQGFCETSDVRLKDDIEDVTDALSTVLKLNAKTYHLKDDPLRQPRIGLIAQEVAEVDSKLVHATDDGHLAVDYSKIGVLAAEALKDHINHDFSDLKKEVQNIAAATRIQSPMSARPHDPSLETDESDRNLQLKILDVLRKDGPTMKRIDIDRQIGKVAKKDVNRNLYKLEKFGIVTRTPNTQIWTLSNSC